MRHDTVGHGHLPALRCAIDSLGAGRLLLGTDFPFEAGEIFVCAVDSTTAGEIGQDNAHAILEGNAAALFEFTGSEAATD